jgi:HK97 family phage prohead protease
MPKENKTPEMKHMIVPCNIELKQMDDPDFFFFEGYASTFGNLDRGDDIVMPGAFLKSITEMQPKLLWQHDHAEPIGVFEEIKEDAKGLFVRGKLPKKDTFVDGRVIPQIGIGSINSMSIGYWTVKSEYDTETDIRKLVEVKLYEISLVSIPMNPEAMITAFKGVDIGKDFEFQNIGQVSKFLKGKGLTNKEANDIVFALKEIIACNINENHGNGDQGLKNPDIQPPCNKAESSRNENSESPAVLLKALNELKTKLEDQPHM